VLADLPMAEPPPRVLFDTSIFVAVERGQLRLPEGYDAGIAAITAAELLLGLERADEARKPRRQVFVENIISTLDVLPFDIAAARVYAALMARLHARGTPIGIPDAIIAATALVTVRSVVTLNDRHFERVAGLQVIVP
jgi:tRNA(fMet)-specific endonuclease VapC